ncbi:MAG: hypothetical protein DIU78_017970 [Pseudomonadota bacterium]|nr:MAG: hypothetical protein DIU78_05950 [Pseudomonadota bacterium]
MAKKTKAEMLEALRGMIREALRLRGEGAGSRLSRVSGTIDGYMRAMMESGLAEARELLDLVAAERARADGPATGEITIDSATLAA